jgi:Universal stress protein UspA and related nucleotide-binding proteins
MQILLTVDNDLSQAEAQIAAIEDMAEVADGMKAFVLHVFGENLEGASVHQVAAVKEAKDRLETTGVSVELLESSGDPASEIIEHAEERGVDQICVGGRKRSPAGKVLFGSVTQEVILGTTRPVLVCGSATA